MAIPAATSESQNEEEKQMEENTQTESNIIAPTVGRIVDYHIAPGKVHAAQIAHVHSDRKINIGALTPEGEHYSAQSVVLVQDGDEVPDYPYAAWMPYQKGQAASPSTSEIDEVIQAIRQDVRAVYAVIEEITKKEPEPEAAPVASEEEGAED